jgi:hypothetical protein
LAKDVEPPSQRGKIGIVRDITPWKSAVHLDKQFVDKQPDEDLKEVFTLPTDVGEKTSRDFEIQRGRQHVD